MARRLAWLAAVVLAALLPVVGAAFAQASLPRVASNNLCTDQLLLALAEPSQILGLGPYARDAQRAWAADRATSHRILSGHAEDILVMKPDLVVAGRFTRRATREMLRAQGVRLEEFDAVRTIAEARAQILRMGRLIRREAVAERLVADIDAAVERARARAQASPVRVLPVQRRGWVTGSATLTSEMLATIGVVNVAAELGLRAGRFVSLEVIVAARPDVLLVTRDDERAEDQGRALLLHPALERTASRTRRVTIPERLTTCGGPMLIEALDLLAAEFERLGGARAATR
ncbi:ABC transporter substrate-binding protein [Phreatobacter sp.]|uniref:ABC transporter substrate-binding protein n=1 Tax=Phreatobacter sp. TaxID=1966341 RepID=UPI003F6F1952